MERGKMTLHAKDLGINPRTAMRWWKHYEETGKAALKTAKQEKRNLAGGKEQRAGDIIIEEPTIEYIDVEESTAAENNKPVAKGITTAHFVRSISELLDIMDMDESLMGSYLVMDYCTIHKSRPMIRKIDSRDYRVKYLSPCSPELNPIEQL
ncbi:hypothetical protein G6F27_003422 [Rhizopus arrhizus]|nr:hypothetical protein G6F27_003422 [Rhizopus arrhizus]